ncbi:MAG: hypothetical protein R6W97_11715 [Thiobacillus sp.]
MKKLLCAFLVLACMPFAHAAPLTATRETYMRDAIDRVTIAAENNDYHLVKIQRIDSALVKRGYDDPGVSILFIGQHAAMEQAQADYPPLLSMLPFKLVLVVRGKDIVVISDDLDAWKEMFPDPAAHRLIERWRSEIILILKDFSAD